jgi:hypothetical protein
MPDHLSHFDCEEVQAALDTLDGTIPIYLTGATSEFLSNIGTWLDTKTVVLVRLERIELEPSTAVSTNLKKFVEKVTRYEHTYLSVLEIGWNYQKGLIKPHPGDSGGVYFRFVDGKCVPIGMHVGSKEGKSYAIPFDKIIDWFEIEESYTIVGW